MLNKKSKLNKKKSKLNKKLNFFIKNLIFNQGLDLFNYDYSNNHFKNNLTTFFIELYKRKAQLHKVNKLNNLLFHLFVKLKLFLFKFKITNLFYLLINKINLLFYVLLNLKIVNQSFIKFFLQFFNINTNMNFLSYLKNLYSNLFYSLSIDLKYTDVLFNKTFIIAYIKKLKKKKCLFFN